MARTHRYDGGQVLRRAREAKGLSREAVGAATCRTAQTVMLWENGWACPPRPVLVRLASELGIDLADLEPVGVSS